MNVSNTHSIGSFERSNAEIIEYLLPVVRRGILDNILLYSLHFFSYQVTSFIVFVFHSQRTNWFA